MKKFFVYTSIIIGVFCIGACGGVLADYVVFTKLISDPAWSQNAIVKALDNRVKVIKSTEKVIVKENESIADIASRTSATVVYIEIAHADKTTTRANGVVMSGDGVIATIADIRATDTVYVRLANEHVYRATAMYSDVYTQLTFLTIAAENLETIPFANSDDARHGKKLISIMQSARNSDPYFASGGLIGHAYDMSIASPTSDYMQGTLKVDFSQSVLDMGIGAPVIDYQGNMVGLIARKTTPDDTAVYYAIAANDVRDAFDGYLRNMQQSKNDATRTDEATQNELQYTTHNDSIRFGVDYALLSDVDIFIDELNITGGARIATPTTYQDKKYFESTIAGKSGLRGGDIVLMVNDTPVNTRDNLSRLLHRITDTDARITLKVLRDGKMMDIPVIRAKK